MEKHYSWNKQQGLDSTETLVNNALLEKQTYLRSSCVSLMTVTDQDYTSVSLPDEEKGHELSDGKSIHITQKRIPKLWTLPCLSLLLLIVIECILSVTMNYYKGVEDAERYTRSILSYTFVKVVPVLGRLLNMSYTLLYLLRMNLIHKLFKDQPTQVVEKLTEWQFVDYLHRSFIVWATLALNLVLREVFDSQSIPDTFMETLCMVCDHIWLGVTGITILVVGVKELYRLVYKH